MVYTLSGIPSGEPPSCETPRQLTIYVVEKCGSIKIVPGALNLPNLFAS